jgi:glycosyltransferase involved in cell wall biosynthesis
VDVNVHAVIVSYKRLPMLQACVRSFLETVRVPHTLMIVDNGSPMDVLVWLVSNPVRFVALNQNHYPGYATNTGWSLASPDANLLMRSDNDSIWLPGWDSELASVFGDPDVGQYGPVAAGDEAWTSLPDWPVGGNTIIRRSLFSEEALRYDETPWPEAKIHEDQQLYLDIRDRGYRRVWSSKPALIYNGMRDPEYDREVAEARGREWEPY